MIGLLDYYNQDKFRNQKVKEHELTLEKNELKRLRWDRIDKSNSNIEIEEHNIETEKVVKLRSKSVKDLIVRKVVQEEGFLSGGYVRTVWWEALRDTWRAVGGRHRHLFVHFVCGSKQILFCVWCNVDLSESDREINRAWLLDLNFG